jgi:hypothetical protein
MNSAQSMIDGDEEAIVSELLGSASRPTPHSQEPTYGLDYWKHQYLKSEAEVIGMDLIFSACTFVVLN